MLTLFFVDDLPTSVGALYEFQNEDALHAVRVLRTTVGDTFNISDGNGTWSKVIVREAAKKSLRVEVIESGFEEALAQTFTVIQAIPKGDRIKEAIELCTEGGADRIVMWKSARSIGKSEDKI